jgi:hypothetical protein
MADLGVIGLPGNVLHVSAPATPALIGRRLFGTLTISTSDTREGFFYRASGRSLLDGNPGGAHIVAAGGKLQARLPIVIGARVLSVQTYQPVQGSLLQPVYFRVFANPSVGLNADLVAASTIAASSGWETVGPLTFTATANGGVLVEIYNTGHYSLDCFIDNLVLS